MRWTVGIQTCPRDNAYYLDNTIGSLSRAGWDDFVVFAEPNSPIPPNCNVTFRPFRYGDWSNWICGLFEMFATNPKSDYFLMVEDDVVFSRNIRDYLDWVIPNLKPFGCLSLYTPDRHYKDFDGWHDESDAEWELSGAQAIVFTRESLQDFLSSAKVLLYRDDPIGRKNAHKDCAIGKWACFRHRVLYHSPSLTDHVGLQSLIGSRPHVAKDFVGENFDCSQKIGELVKVLPVLSSWSLL